MIKKLVSLAMGVFILNVYIRSQLSPNDPLFLFVSGSTALNIGLILLSYLLVIVSFNSRFKSWLVWAACGGLAALLMVIGGLGIFPGILSSYWISNNLPPMDSMLVLEASVILGLCTLTYEHAPQPDLIKNFNFIVLRQKLATLSPKILHSPDWFSRTPLSNMR